MHKLCWEHYKLVSIETSTAFNIALSPHFIAEYNDT